ncbi:hypothetical protein TRFO_07027 [Tritrichomonas foetus]|uniref:Doublecortin domain-containing protein n=1 Tax=Tritrichomonas foetus TaxID=1144522 RepID=A0A1J4JYN9_9EUKA|nr:hypothetical protein TRFO_07027 [Tritrichomonas foetus]|eukprot:OHT02614.1 hypothetical protein TRFO_07027 [Tritrichomonas foetus]
MSTTHSTSTSTSVGYVFVRIRGTDKKLRPAKRVLIPGTLQIFRKNVQNIFKMKQQIKAFYTADGQFIHNVNQLELGTTIIASTEEPEGENAGFDFEHEDIEKFVREFDPSAPLPFTEYPKPKKVQMGGAPKCLVVGFPEPLTIDQANLRIKKKKNPVDPATSSGLSRSSRISSRKKSPNSPLFAQKDDNPNVVPTANFHFFDQASYAFVSDDTSVATTSIRPQKIQAKKAAKVKTKVDNTRNLMSILFNSNELGDLKYLNEALARLRKDQLEFITKAESQETAQKQFWIKELNSLLDKMNFCEKTKGLFLENEIHEYVKKVVLGHRFISGNGALHRLNIGIIGPTKSGKSTLLYLLSQELLLDLIVCDDWKKSFIFPMNFNQIASKIEKYKEFYLEMIQNICFALVKQKPTLQKWISSIKKYYESLIDKPIPLILSKSCMINKYILNIQNKLMEVGSFVNNAWNTPSGFEWWYTLIFELPSLISSVLGFEKTIYIIDNLEKCDLTLEPHKPFNSTSQVVILSEHVKNALSRNDYIFACHNMEYMYSMLPSIDNDGIDLFSTTDFVTTNGISTDIVENDPPLLMILDTEELPFVMKGCDCDGVPNYILLWKDLNQMIDEMEGMKEETDEFDDAHYFAVSHAQAMLNHMFFDEDADYTDVEESNWPHVLGIRRSTKKEQREFMNEEKENAHAIQIEIQNLTDYEYEEEEEEN